MPREQPRKDTVRAMRRRSRYPTGKRLRKGRPYIEVRWPPYLFAAILAEAKAREISFNAVVIELCEASIGGIE